MKNRLVMFISNILFILIIISKVFPQIQTTPPEGIRKKTPRIHALVNARIVVKPGVVIPKGAIVFRNGIIEDAGPLVKTPADARIWDMSGMTVYPGFIETCSNLGLEDSAVASPGQRVPPGSISPIKNSGSTYWNEWVKPQQHSDNLYIPDMRAVEKYRSQGFTVALIVPPKGIVRGSCALVTLGDSIANRVVLKREAAQYICLSIARDPSTIGINKYPGSLMGTIALIRQSFLDAQWYRAAQEEYAIHPYQQRPETNEALDALDGAIRNKTPFIIEVSDELNLLRAVKIAKEFSVPIAVRGSGYEYRRLEAVKKSGVPVILPVNFPLPPSVETAEEALSAGLAELRHFNQAPDNPKLLQEAGVPFSLSAIQMKNTENFLTNVRKTVARGLSADAALTALTITPARLLGIENRLGTLESGKIANLVVSDGNLFDGKTKIAEVWIDGNRHEVKPKSEKDPRGMWTLDLTFQTRKDTARLELKGEMEKLIGSFQQNKRKMNLTSAFLDFMLLTITFPGDSIGYAGMVRMSGNVYEKEMIGSGELGDGAVFVWSAKRKSSYQAPPDTSKKKEDRAVVLEPVYPTLGFGRTRPPAQPERLLIRSATVWTCSSAGTLKNTDLLIEKGKITGIGNNLSTPAGTTIIHAEGKHVTPGIIDSHSHIAGSSMFNEPGQAITSETRIEDVLTGDDISIYREVAGGVTTACILHGSLNPIGGQCAVVKLRWGALPDELVVENAPPVIKLALGENVKLSSSSPRPNRYPKTRMGTEQIIWDEFQAAIEYKYAWQKYLKDKKGVPPRRDLELEPIVEVLEGKRMVHAHAYRQDEALMLMRLAESFHFKIALFVHILEGYKIADAIARHGAGATTFSDWWSYKFEAFDAIPFNGTLMAKAGVLVSFSSDDDELARHLNSEAAKAIKYGNLAPEEALKLVTLNPARQLQIDKWVGSIEPGKDADFVIWNGHPLSSYSLCEQTWIDGKKYFDREEDKRMQETVAKERALLIQKAIASKSELKSLEAAKQTPKYELDQY